MEEDDIVYRSVNGSNYDIADSYAGETVKSDYDNDVYVVRYEEGYAPPDDSNDPNFDVNDPEINPLDY